MQVIQDQRDRRIMGRQRCRQPQQEDVAGVPRLPGGQRRRDGNVGPAQCRDDMGPEDTWLVVEFI